MLKSFIKDVNFFKYFLISKNILNISNIGTICLFQNGSRQDYDFFRITYLQLYFDYKILDQVNFMGVQLCGGVFSKGKFLKCSI